MESGGLGPPVVGQGGSLVAPRAGCPSRVRRRVHPSCVSGRRFPRRAVTARRERRRTPQPLLARRHVAASVCRTPRGSAVPPGRVREPLAAKLPRHRGAARRRPRTAGALGDLRRDFTEALLTPCWRRPCIYLTCNEPRSHPRPSLTAPYARPFSCSLSSHPRSSSSSRPQVARPRHCP